MASNRRNPSPPRNIPISKCPRQSSTKLSNHMAEAEISPDPTPPNSVVISVTGLRPNRPMSIVRGTAELSIAMNCRP